MKKAIKLITAQAVGAYGERVVEAELLRRGWIVSNVNASVKNAAVFDILAWKGKGQPVPIRVKTCGPGQEVFQFGFKPGPVDMGDLREVDFMILVAMGEERTTDCFYVLPTSVVWNALEARRQSIFSKPKRKDGLPRKETGRININLRGKGEHRDFARKWAGYVDAWDLLSP
jgi:hypothetical protein